eukprot:5978685-Pleurochrysis_carterae.AAC.1
MREYNRLLAKRIIGLDFPQTPDGEILKFNRMRPGTQQVITTKSLRDQQRDFRKYIDASSRLTVDEKDDMFHNFNLH